MMTRKEKAALVVQALSGVAVRCTLCGASGPIAYRVREGQVLARGWSPLPFNATAPDSHMFCARCVYRVQNAFGLTHFDSAIAMLVKAIHKRDFGEIMTRLK